MTISKQFLRFTLLGLLFLQGCSTVTYREPLPPVEDKSTQAPVIMETPAPPPRVQVVVPRAPSQAPEAVDQPPAVVALLDTAEQQASDGDLGASAASLERAIRISPADPVLWHHLAQVRLQQGDTLQAEQLAVKSNSLAPGNRAQQARNWRLIAEARRQRDDTDGANAAERKARELEHSQTS